MNEIERAPFDSDLLQTFSVIAACRNLTVAAGRLHRTQSAISVQLRKLETSLGVSLFTRTPKGMILTPAGEQLLPRATSILADIQQAGAMFTAPLTGSIRVGLPDDFDENVLENVLSNFSRAHPGVHVIAASGCTAQYPAAISDGTLDIAVCSGPDNTAGDALGTEDTVWAARTDLHIDVDAPVPLAILDRDCWWRDLAAAALLSAGREYAITFRSSSFASLQAALRAGFAIGTLPRSSVAGGLRVLKSAEGFPALPASHRSILIGADAPPDLTDAMASAIRDAKHRLEHLSTA